MHRAIRWHAAWLATALAAVLWATACTLHTAVPVQTPPQPWDPTLNTHPDSMAFQRLLDRYVREGMPGVVLLVRTPRGQWNGASGYAGIETHERMLPTHLHHVASVTKMYVAAAVMLLAQEGLLDLDARISRYLPEPVYGQIPNGAEVTVRQLLGHTSGIPDFGQVMAYDVDFMNDPLGSYPTERLLGYLRGQSPKFAPGTGWLYSNVNYVLLGMIIDRVAGTSHARVISERVLRPLGLTATFYKDGGGYPTPPGLVNSYTAVGGRLMNVSDQVIHAADVFAGNAGLIASSADLATFIEAVLDGRVVGPGALAQMTQRNQHYSGYGLGLSIRDTPYGPAIGHDGASTGTLSLVRHFPNVNATLVILVNAGGGRRTEDAFLRLERDAIREALGGP